MRTQRKKKIQRMRKDIMSTLWKRHCYMSMSLVLSAMLGTVLIRCCHTLAVLKLYLHKRSVTTCKLDNFICLLHVCGLL